MRKKKFTFLICSFLFFQYLIFTAQYSLAQTYFQQEVNTEIHVSLNDANHELNASERMEYTNRSPVALNEIYIHLWANGYRNENTALANQFSEQGDPVFLNTPETDRGFIDSLDFKVDGNKIQWSFLPDTMDICKLKLGKPLMPGEKITITTPFHVKIPSATISRLGHAGQAYYITQWFPKPAVFDRNGWNYFPYLNQGEYYSEFGTYDVFITLPENYVIGTSGILVDGEKETGWLMEKAKQTKLKTTFADDMNFPPSSSTYKTLHYHQGKVHDFAWFADKRWHVLQEDIELPDSKKKVTAWLMFTNAEADYWMKAMDYMRSSLNYFSRWIGEYPFNNVTAVDVNNSAGNGMEYPGIVAIGNYGNLFELETTFAHEIGHLWFYGMLGSNERLHPWMDEGLTKFLETRYVYTKYAGDAEKQLEGTGKTGSISRRFGLDKINHRKIQYLDYLFNARKNSDQAPETPAGRVAFSNYHGDVYFKTAISFDFLKSYLGDSVFDACLQRYFNEWKFKHPMPEDLKNSFATTSGKDLDWLFNELIRTTKKLDYKISAIKLSDDKKNYLLTVRNTGGVAAPLSISSLKSGEVKNTLWLDGFRKKEIVSVPCNGCDAFRIDAAEKMPELYQANNTIRTNGLLKKTEPVHFQWLGSLEDATKTQIFFSPVVGWNNYDKAMVGAAFYNIFIPEKKFEYVVMPMFAFGTSNLAGGGKLTYHSYPANSFIQKITWSAGVQSYSYATDQYEPLDQSFHYSSTLQFRKLDSRIAFLFRQKNPVGKIRSTILFRNVVINRDMPYFFSYRPSTFENQFYELSYNRENSNKLFPSDFNLSLRASNVLVKAALERKYKITYDDISKGLDIRIFGGFNLYRSTYTKGIDYHLQLSGNSTAVDDRITKVFLNEYMFDEVFLGRTEYKGILSRQFIANDGGFKVPTFLFREADRWMVAVNLKTSVPGILPLKLFADIGTFDHAADLTAGSSISFDAGIELDVIKDIFTIYFPIAYSDDIKFVVDTEELNFGDLIRFELHLNKLNPITLIKQLDF